MRHLRLRDIVTLRRAPKNIRGKAAIRDDCVLIGNQGPQPGAALGLSRCIPHQQ